MKVFISWSGELSKKLGEAIRDWLPGVLQLVKPYFTPSDIEKGSRWANEIGKELEASKIGVLCITRDNLHSDWVLFEAGALSKSLDKAHVCPILFGISNTDLAGPLKQFQTTEFNKGDFHKLMTVINSRLGENKLSQKTLDNVFEKWWPDLEKKVNTILKTANQTNAPLRSEREILEEVLALSRITANRSSLPSRISPKAVRELLIHYIELHDEQVEGIGSYQDTLTSMRRMHKAIRHIVVGFKDMSDELNELFKRFENLSYQAKEQDKESDDVPF